MATNPIRATNYFEALPGQRLVEPEVAKIQTTRSGV